MNDNLADGYYWIKGHADDPIIAEFYYGRWYKCGSEVAIYHEVIVLSERLDPPNT